MRNHLISFNILKKVSKLQFLVKNSNEKLKWEFKQGYTAAYAVQGHRSHMEDRFVVNNDIENTGVSIFAIFDGHGGEVSLKLVYSNVQLNNFFLKCYIHLE